MDEQIQNKKSSFSWLFIIIIIVVLLGVVWFLSKNLKVFGGGSAGVIASSDQSVSDYQAVFLTNNQVYFGKLKKETSQFAQLTDIFYLQVAQPLQPSQPNSQVTLVKLGNELHGPADVMNINRDHILFVENIKPESQVAKAIAQYQASQATAEPVK